MVLLLFLLAASPLVYHWLDHTLVFYDRIAGNYGAVSPVTRIHWYLSYTEDDLCCCVHWYNVSKDIFTFDLKKGINDIKSFIEKCPITANPFISLISFYVTVDSGDVCWLGYNLEPPHLEGQFGLDRASPVTKKNLEKFSRRFKHPLYGSSSIDSPPASDDRRYLFKASDSVVWIRAVDLETELKKSVSEKEPDHDEQVF